MCTVSVLATALTASLHRVNVASLVCRLNTAAPTTSFALTIMWLFEREYRQGELWHALQHDVPTALTHDFRWHRRAVSGSPVALRRLLILHLSPLLDFRLQSSSCWRCR